MDNQNNPNSLIQLFRRLWVHIHKKRKVQFLFLLLLTLLTSVAEVVSLGAVLPFIGILTQPDKVLTSPWLKDLINLLNINSGDELVLPLTIAFGIAAIVAGTLRLLLLWVSIRLSNATGAAAGLGTALSQTQTSPLNKIYFTDNILSIGATVTIDPPPSSTVAYTNYSEIKISGADLIIKDGDDFIPDILGLSTTSLRGRYTYN